MDSAVLERSVPYNADQVSFATPVNSGAHRLAWWIARCPTAGADGAIAILTCAGIMPASIDRLISGELIPVDYDATMIARATDGAVLPDDWDRAATGTWGDAPIPHERLTA